MIINISNKIIQFFGNDVRKVSSRFRRFANRLGKVRVLGIVKPIEHVWILFDRFFVIV